MFLTTFGQIPLLFNRQQRCPKPSQKSQRSPLIQRRPFLHRRQQRKKHKPKPKPSQIALHSPEQPSPKPAMLASPLTATIYLPLLPLLVTHFHVSIQAINHTITLYMIFQAISPLLLATASNSFDRRPILSLVYAVYTVASLGLALNKSSYAVSLILRAA